ncbi:hypothetical protein B0H14DRAFT_2567324 [Mycena olivaceomarginata]|nr:hypothetical protein B0H14DRAFT_2567324 [Mycena olivaceomarginata]
MSRQTNATPVPLAAHATGPPLRRCTRPRQRTLSGLTLREPTPVFTSPKPVPSPPSPSRPRPSPHVAAFVRRRVNPVRKPIDTPSVWRGGYPVSRSGVLALEQGLTIQHACLTVQIDGELDARTDTPRWVPRAVYRSTSALVSTARRVVLLLARLPAHTPSGVACLVVSNTRTYPDDQAANDNAAVNSRLALHLLLERHGQHLRRVFPRNPSHCGCNTDGPFLTVFAGGVATSVSLTQGEKLLFITGVWKEKLFIINYKRLSKAIFDVRTVISLFQVRILEMERINENSSMKITYCQESRWSVFLRPEQSGVSRIGRFGVQLTFFTFLWGLPIHRPSPNPSRANFDHPGVRIWLRQGLPGKEIAKKVQGNYKAR